LIVERDERIFSKNRDRDSDFFLNNTIDEDYNNNKGKIKIEIKWGVGDFPLYNKTNPFCIHTHK